MLNLKDLSHITAHDLLDEFMKEKAPRVSINTNSYKGNWNLLMRVVDKIEEIEWEEGSYTDVFIGPSNYVAITTQLAGGAEHSVEGNTKVDSLYYTILQFVSWYSRYSTKVNEQAEREKEVENNVLIAEAINMEQANSNSGLLNYKYNNSYFEAHELSFNVSWDWLLHAAHILFKDNPYGFQSFIVENLTNNDITKAFNEIVYYINFNKNNQ